MAIVVIVENGNGLANANSYVSVAECDTYHAATLNAEAWTGASADDKAIAVVMATRLIDSLFQFYGVVTFAAQALQWPRLDCPDPDRNFGSLPDLSFFRGNMVPFNMVPVFVKNSTCELARVALVADRVTDPSWQGIKELVVGGTSSGMTIVFDKTDAPPIVPLVVQQTLMKYGGYIGARGGQVKLSRT